MKDATEIVMVMDKSGSMGHLAADTIGTFNTFLKEQQNLDKPANLTLILFDTDYQTIYESAPIKDVQELTPKVYQPEGCTALLDAMGKGIDSLGKHLKNTKEKDRPDKVIFVIITDGEENSSRHFNQDQIKSMVEHQQQKYSWQFLFLGANIDSFSTAGGLGIQAQSVSNYAASSIGVRSVGASVSHAVSSYRLCGDVDESWSRGIVSDDSTNDDKNTVTGTITTDSN